MPWRPGTEPFLLTLRVWRLSSASQLPWILSLSVSLRQTLTLPPSLDLPIPQQLIGSRGNTSIAPSSVGVTTPPNVSPRPGLIICVYIGFFQGYGPYNNRSIQSRFLTQSSYQRQCLEIFPAGSVPAEPNVGAINSAYGGWRMNPTHVFFTNGQIDPWRTLSIGSFEENAPKRVGTTAIPA